MATAVLNADLVLTGTLTRRAATTNPALAAPNADLVLTGILTLARRRPEWPVSRETWRQLPSILLSMMMSTHWRAATTGKPVSREIWRLLLAGVDHVT